MSSPANVARAKPSNGEGPQPAADLVINWRDTRRLQVILDRRNSSFHIRTVLNSEEIDDDVTVSAGLDTWPDSESSVRRYQPLTPAPHLVPRYVDSARIVFFALHVQVNRRVRHADP